MEKPLDELLEEYGRLPEWLGEKTPRLNSASLFGDYPINVAATRGNIQEIETLVQAGANVNQRGEHGYTPLHNAVEQNHLHVVVFLLENGADASARNDAGDTPLALAGDLGAAELVRLLGADL